MDQQTMLNIMKNSDLYLQETASFERIEVYGASVLNCFAFRRGTDVRSGITISLGNMVNGYPFAINGVQFANSECAYICGAFSDGTPQHLAIQQKLAACTNGYLAKKSIRRPYEGEKRTDWETFNIQWMFYVVWQKCIGNSDFRKLLLSLPHNAVIIEDSTFQNGRTATVWGTKNYELKKRLMQYKKELKAEGGKKAEIKRRLDAKRLGEWSHVGCFVGQNIMGKILMLCRDALLSGTEPAIDFGLLRSARINLLGQELSFNQQLQVA